MPAGPAARGEVAAGRGRCGACGMPGTAGSPAPRRAPAVKPSGPALAQQPRPAVPEAGGVTPRLELNGTVRVGRRAAAPPRPPR